MQLRTPHRTIIAAVSVACALLSGCLHSRPDDFILAVPFHRQAPHECGVAALRMVLDFYGMAYDPAAVRAHVFLPAVKGTLPAVVADEALRLGLDASIQSLSQADLVQQVAQGRPVIILLAPPPGSSEPQTGHLAVVAGVSPDERSIFLHGNRRPNRRVALTAIEPLWAAAQHTSILIAPRRMTCAFDDSDRN
jgi:ABC-type bacteriocin/lantibiotic exporter with double-glycine peptidase domain